MKGVPSSKKDKIYKEITTYLCNKGGYMAEDYGLCSLCKKGKLVKKEEKEVSDTTYLMLKCNKCDHQVARSVKWLKHKKWDFLLIGIKDSKILEIYDFKMSQMRFEKMGNEVSLQRVEGQGAKKCPECGSDRIVRKDDEVYCEKCGFVMD